MGKATDFTRLVGEKRPEPAIFLQSYELMRDLMGMTPHFAKPARYSLGRRMDEQAMSFLLALSDVVGPSGVRTDEPSRRALLLTQLSRDLDQLRILLRLSRDLGCISAGQHEAIVSRILEIGRQLGGMIRAVKARLEPSG